MSFLFKDKINTFDINKNRVLIVGRAILGQNQTLNLGFLPLNGIFFKSFLPSPKSQCFSSKFKCLCAFTVL